MNVIHLCTAVLLLSSASLTQAQEPQWQEAKSPEGKFKALLPGIPKKIVQEADSPVGKIKVYVPVSETDGGKAAYLVIYSDYSAAIVQQLGAEMILVNAQKGALQSVNGTVQKETKITLGRSPGPEFQFTGTAQNMQVFATWRIYLVENRMYQLGVMGTGMPVPAETIQKFFNSFAVDDRER